MSPKKKSLQRTLQRRSKSSEEPAPLDVKDLWDLPPWNWPRNAAQALLLLLRDREAPEEDRLMAVELVGGLCDEREEPIMACLEILTCSTEPEALRCAAVISMGPTLEQVDCLCDLDSEVDYEEPWISSSLFEEVKATLHHLWQSPSVPKMLRRRVLEASVRAIQDWHTEAIRTAYNENDRDWKLTAVFAMQYVRGFEVEILEALEHSDPEIHHEAVRAAGIWELEKAWPHVRSILAKAPRDKHLLLAAIEAAPSLSPSEAGDLLFPYLDSRDEDIAEVTIEAVSLLDGGALDDYDEDEWEEHFFREEEDDGDDGDGDNLDAPKGNVTPFRR